MQVFKTLRFRRMFICEIYHQFAKSELTASVFHVEQYKVCTVEAPKFI